MSRIKSIRAPPYTLESSRATIKVITSSFFPSIAASAIRANRASFFLPGSHHQPRINTSASACCFSVHSGSSSTSRSTCEYSFSKPLLSFLTCHNFSSSTFFITRCTRVSLYFSFIAQSSFLIRFRPS